MKKLIIFCSLLFSFSFVNAQTDASRIEFDYYPEANIYYNTKANTYAYFDSAAKKWETTAELPKGHTIADKSKKTKLYSDAPEIWLKNASHVKMFGNKSAPAKAGQK